MNDWLVVPMLAEPIASDSLALQILQREDWHKEQKLDGVRLLIHIHDGEVIGVNRKGVVTMVPKAVKDAFAAFDGEWVFDGELIKGVYWIFDLVRAHSLVTPVSEYTDRRNTLDFLWPSLQMPSAVRLLPSYTDPIEGMELAQQLKAHNAEGMIFKRGNAPYISQRTQKMRKWKFWESVDCIVTELWREGKQSMGVCLFDEDGSPVDIGSVTMTPANLGKVKQFDVVEVKYLYVDDPKEPRLYQPSFLRIRDDKDAEECLTSQLKYTNKTVMEAQ